MSNVIYAIVFKGEILEGFQPISVKAHMAKLLRADIDKMTTLFSGKPVVIKRTTDKQEAVKYGNALKKIGADIKVRLIKSDTPVPAPESPADTEDGGLAVLPNEGNLVEPAPPPPPPDIDLSGISLADDNEAPLAEPKEDAHLELDLSEYSVLDNDGSPLVEPHEEEVPEIEVPDFGLDEPGAVLETIREEKEPVNPDTSGITLAMPGEDLLKPDERPPDPPPVVPDTSNLKLVSSFD